MFCLDDYHSFNAAIMQARSDDTMYHWSCRKLINVFTDGDTAVKPKLQQQLSVGETQLQPVPPFCSNLWNIEALETYFYRPVPHCFLPHSYMVKLIIKWVVCWNVVNLWHFTVSKMHWTTASSPYWVLFCNFVSFWSFIKTVFEQCTDIV